MSTLLTTRHQSLRNRQGRMFADVLDASKQPRDAALEFSICGDRQPPRQVSETYRNRIPLAELLQEYEGQPPIEDFLSSNHTHGTKRIRHSAGATVHMLSGTSRLEKDRQEGFPLGVRAPLAPLKRSCRRPKSPSPEQVTCREIGALAGIVRLHASLGWD